MHHTLDDDYYTEINSKTKDLSIQLMAVLVASLFLPFKPQFEIDASVNEAAVLLESQNIKLSSNVATSVPASSSSNNVTEPQINNANTIPTSSSVPPTFYNGNDNGLEGNNTTVSNNNSGVRATSLQPSSQHHDNENSNKVGANGQILSKSDELETDTKEASDAFMESLTTNATSSAMDTPKPSNTIAGLSTTVSSNHSLVNCANIPNATTTTNPPPPQSSQHGMSTSLQHPLPRHQPSKLSQMSSATTTGAGDNDNGGSAAFTMSGSSSSPSEVGSINYNLMNEGSPTNLMQTKYGAVPGGLSSQSLTPMGNNMLPKQKNQETTNTDRLDPTAALLKTVSKNLAGGNSFNSFTPPKPSHLSTVIQPKSRDLPASEQSSTNKLFRDISAQPSTTSMRRVHRSSSNTAPIGHSPLQGQSQLQGLLDNDEAIKEEDNNNNKKDEGANSGGVPALSNKKKMFKHHDYSLESLAHSNNINSGSNNTGLEDAAFFSDDGYDLLGDNKRGDSAILDNEVPEFGGYSNADFVKGSLLGGSQNIFSKASWEIVASYKCNNGLTNAINTAILEKTFNQQIVWVGSLGIPTDTLPEKVLTDVSSVLDSDFHCKTVIADDITFKGAYKNFCKEILWPTFHYQIPDNPKSKAFEDHSWQHYQRLNQLFADKIVESYNEGDTVWVNDYHLLLVPGMVREKLPNAKIGFSLHISFPSSEVFRCFAQRKTILKGLLGANTVGFQTDEYARHFIYTCNRLLMTDGDIQEGIRYNGRMIQINTTPIGIDAFNVQKQLLSDAVATGRQIIRTRWGHDKHLIVSYDQFDSLRGLKNKFLSYERFLKTNPHYIKKCCFIQVFNGSSIKDLDLEKDIVSIVDRINSLSEDISLTAQPVVLLHQQLEPSQRLALLSEADCFFVNSMREGMNLTCHDFIVCTQEKNSPLLISEFTGSAELLKKGCLLINPWDIRRVAEMIKVALKLNPAEKRRRWKKMMKKIIINDSDNWIISMIKGINESWELNKQRSTIFNLSYSDVASAYNSCKTKNKLFVLKISQPPTAAVLKMLNELCVDNEVYVMNSFDKSLLERYYARVNNLNLIAENGAFVRIHGHWYTIMSDNSWAREVLPLLQSKLERLPGSYIKAGESMFRVHTENAEDQDRVDDVVGDLILHINTLFCSTRSIHAYYHKQIVFVQQMGLSLKAMKFIFSYYGSHSNELHYAFNNSEGGRLSSVFTSQQLQRQNSSSSIGGGNGGGNSSSGSNADVTNLKSDDQRTRPTMSPTPSFNNLNSLDTSQVGMMVNDRTGVNKFSFACITGSSSPVIEPIFKYINSLQKHLSYTFTCVYGDPSSTNAQQHVDGMNDLLKILSAVCDVDLESEL